MTDAGLIVDTVIPLLVDKMLTVELTQPESVEPPFDRRIRRIYVYVRQHGAVEPLPAVGNVCVRQDARIGGQHQVGQQLPVVCPDTLRTYCTA